MYDVVVWNMTFLQSLLATEWFKGFLSGVAATLLGFILTMLWDLWKAGTEARERERSVLSAISEELVANKSALDEDLALLSLELSFLAQQKHIVQPLIPMKTGFWELAKVHFPRKVLDPKSLQLLRDLAFLAERVNYEITSRESYRIHNIPMSNFCGRMMKYDQSLVALLNELNQAIAAYQDAASTNAGRTRNLLSRIRCWISRRRKGA